MYTILIINALTKNTTMNDREMTELLLTSDNPIDAYATLMDLVADTTVIMSDNIDATGRTVGGVYSLPTSRTK